MAVSTEATKKEATILGLSEEIGKLLDDLEARLDNRFNRTPRPTAGESGRPEIPNVLDEILEQLEHNRVFLAQQISFISSDVLPKIN